MTDEAPDAVGVIHLLADDGRWLCRVPDRDLGTFRGEAAAIGAEHGGTVLRCADCDRQLERGRWPRPLRRLLRR